MIFEYGYKAKRKSKMQEYVAKREWKDLVTYSQNLYEQSEKERGIIEMHELFKQSKWDRECLPNNYCVIVTVPNIKDSSAIQRNEFLDTLKKIASKNKQSFKKFVWFWMQQGDQPLFDQVVNPEGYPVMVWDSDTNSYVFMK